MPIMHPFGDPGVVWSNKATLTGTFPMASDITVNTTTGRWMVAGHNGSSAVIWYSTDGGSTWTSVAIGSVGLESVEFGAGLFLTSQTAGDNLYSSPDGTTWTARISGVSRDHHKINYNDGYFTLGSGLGGGSGYLYASTNGTTWQTNGLPAVGANSVQCGIYVASLNRTFAAGVQKKYANTNPVSITAWTGTPTGYSGTVRSVAWSPELARAVLVGTTGVASSSDLITWTPRIASGNFYDVIWTGDQFVAVGDAMIYTSPDGITWTSRSAGTSDVIMGVAHYSGTLLAVTSGGIILVSQ